MLCIYICRTYSCQSQTSVKVVPPSKAMTGSVEEEIQAPGKVASMLEMTSLTWP